ncbi:heme-binding protein [Moraxellaceae bacterium AER2_44_116]|nr:heme-binding protein [Moraxellaceae bacterium]TQC99156.1 heme-binding protein [Moraxellaceae bacterium AER2_44_116]
MKHLRLVMLTTIVTMSGAMDAMAVEETAYSVVKKDQHFEIRDYAPHVLAETIADGDMGQAGNSSFGVLFRYISGSNQSQTKVAMTAPVSQQPMGEKISMTAPVSQQRVQDKWVVSFAMPASYTLETAPKPTDARVALRQIPARRIASVTYSGLWTEKNYLQHKQELEVWIRKNGLSASGEPVLARYNPPFTPWFLRRNEVLIPISTTH